MEYTRELRDRLLAHDARAWREVQGLVRRCSRHAAHKVGADHLEDDVAAEVLILMHERFVRELQPSAPLAAFLAEVARRVALAMRRRRHEDRLVCAEDDDGSAIEAESAQDDALPMAFALHRAQLARDRIEKSVGDRFWRPTESSKPAPRNQYRCGDVVLAEALKQERRARGWTQRQMAAYMGLKLPTYISYEHACVISPRADVVDMLRQMQAERQQPKKT